MWLSACCPQGALGDTAVLRGRRLWPVDVWPSGFSSHRALVALRSVLGLLDVEAAKQATFKCFRAGHATEMAAQGYSLASILEAGSWKSGAFARYIDEDVADNVQVVRMAMEFEDDD